MFSSLLSRHRSGRPRRLAARNDGLSPPTGRRRQAARQFTGRTHATADFTEADDDDDDDDDDDFNEEEFSRLEHDDHQDNEDAVDEDEEEDDEEEDGDGQQAGGLPVLPLFSSSHLGT